MKQILVTKFPNRPILLNTSEVGWASALVAKMRLEKNARIKAAGGRLDILKRTVKGNGK